MAVKGTASSADFQPQGDITDMARPPDDLDQGDLGRPTRRMGTRRGRRGKRLGRRQRVRK